MPCCAAASTSSVIRPSPSSRLNSEWTWRCVKSFGAVGTGVNGSRGMVPTPAFRPTGYGPGMHPSSLTEIDIEAIVIDALERLPAPFRDQLGSVAIVIDEEASPELLASVGAPGLFGLYQGIPRTSLSADRVPAPSKITIFQGPLRRAHRDPAALAAAVVDTVYHEIAHHFGISDRRLQELKQTGR